MTGLKILKSALASWVPPVIMQPGRRLWRRMNGLGWHNLYGSWPRFADVPVTPWNDDRDPWAESVRPGWWAAVKAATAAPATDSGQTILPLLASQFTGPLTVCDFGGGAAVGLANMIRYGRFDLARLSYVLVETPAVGRAVRAELEAHSGRAVDDIPAALPAPLIVNASSSLQYTRDYPATLARLAKLGPQYLILGQTPLTDNPTFACQILNTPHRVMATWVFNRRELIDRLRALGFELIFAVDHNIPLTHGKANGRTVIGSMVFVPVQAGDGLSRNSAAS